MTTDRPFPFSRTGSRSAIGVRAIGRIVVVLVVIGVLLRAYATFLPSQSLSRAPVPTDAAIPILMANDPVVDALRVYFYGQDRFGAWPWLTMAVVGRLTGYRWTADAVYTVQFGYVVAGLLALAWLSGRRWRTVLLGGALLLAFEAWIGSLLLEISQPYGWQLGTVFLFWALLRAAQPSLARWRPATIASVVGLAGLAFLAQWMSTASMLLLAIVVLWEVRRTGRSPRAWSAVVGLLVLGVAVAGERLLHRWVMDTTAAAGVRLETTNVGFTPIDTWGNAATRWSAVVAGNAWLAAVIWGILVALVITGLLARRDVTVAGDGVGLPIVLMGIVYACSLVMISHVVGNPEPRYLAPVASLACLGLVGLIASSVARLMPATRVRAITGAVAAIGVLVLVVAQVDIGVPRSSRFARPAAELTRLGAMAVVGFYSDVYPIAAEAPDRPLTPIALGGIGGWPGEDRTPWTIGAADQADSLLMVLDAERARFGPSAYLPLRGLLLERPEVVAGRDTEFAIVRYRIARDVEAVPVRYAPPKPSIDLCQKGWSYDVLFDQPRVGPLMVIVLSNRADPDRDPDIAIEALDVGRITDLPWEIEGSSISTTVPAGLRAIGIRLVSSWNGTEATYEGCHLPAVGIYRPR